MSMSFQDIVKIGDGRAIVLCFAEDDYGKKFFHYIISDRESIKQMYHDYDHKKEVDFSAYGQIIHSGWGEKPTAEDEKFVRETFGK